MIKFVVIASTMRGAVEPAESLNDFDNATANEHLEMEAQLQRETVVWHRGNPYVNTGRRVPETDLKPKVSAEVMRLLRGLPMEMTGEKAARDRERRGMTKRIG